MGGGESRGVLQGRNRQAIDGSGQTAGRKHETYLPGVGTELGAIAGEVRKRNLKTNSNYTKESVKNIGYGVAKDKIIEAVDRKKLLVQ